MAGGDGRTNFHSSAIAAAIMLMIMMGFVMVILTQSYDHDAEIGKAVATALPNVRADLGLWRRKRSRMPGWEI